MIWQPMADSTEGLIAVWLCVVTGAMVLTQYTRLTGFFGFLLNGAVLYAGAMAANYITSGLHVPLTFFVQKTLLASFAGMLACSLLMLTLFARQRGG